MNSWALQVSVHSWLALRQAQHSRRDWGRKAANIMAAMKERAKGGSGERDIALPGNAFSDSPPLTRSHFLTASHNVPVIQ